jgi:hypothetical protein
MITRPQFRFMTSCAAVLAITAIALADPKTIFDFDSSAKKAPTTTAATPSTAVLPETLAVPRTEFETARKKAMADYAAALAAAQTAYVAQLEAELKVLQGSPDGAAAEVVRQEIARVKAAAAAPSGAAAASDASKALVVKSARFGLSDKWIDVTEQMNGLAQQGKFELHADMRKFFQKDPFPYKMKYLEMDVLLYGHPVHLVVGDNEKISSLKFEERTE